MISMKMILAFLLAALPFFYASFLRPKKDSTSAWRNMFTAIGSQMPRLKAFKNAVAHFMHRLYDGMKRSDNFRKFFSLIVLLLMIGVQFIDFSASTAIAKGSQEYAVGSTELAQYEYLYSNLMSRPYATLVAACISLSIFSFRAADWILSGLHNSRRIFLFFALLALIFLFASPRYLIVTEILEMMLMAALIYPNKIIHAGPKGGLRIPDENKEEKFRKAA